jgi:hypothetical protein
MLYNVGKQTVFISATTGAIDTSVISANEVIHTGPLVFQNCASKVKGSGRITGFSVIEKAATGVPLKQILKLYLFAKSISPSMNSNDAFSLPNFDTAKEIVAVIPVTWDVTYGSYAFADNNGKFHPIDFVCDAQDLYGYLVAGGGATYAADAQLAVKLHIQQDDSCGC